MIIVRQSGNMYPVRLVHWWPGRVYAKGMTGGIRVPVRYKDCTPGAVRYKPLHKNTRYMTAATVALDDMFLTGFASCGPKDKPSREVGRFIALLRLARGLKEIGLTMERVG